MLVSEPTGAVVEPKLYCAETENHWVMFVQLLFVNGFSVGVNGVPGGYSAGAPGFWSAYATIGRSALKASYAAVEPVFIAAIALVKLKVLVALASLPPTIG